MGPKGPASTASARARWRRWGFQLPHQGGPHPVHNDPDTHTNDSTPQTTHTNTHSQSNSTHPHTPNSGAPSETVPRLRPPPQPPPTKVQTTLHQEISWVDKESWYGDSHLLKEANSRRFMGGNINGLPTFFPNEKEPEMWDCLSKHKADVACMSEHNNNLSQLPQKANLYARSRSSPLFPVKWTAAHNVHTKSQEQKQYGGCMMITMQSMLPRVIAIERDP